jgi:solute carrier family 35 protein E3
MWHFTCTATVLYFSARRPFSLFVPVRLPFWQMIPLCAFFAGFLVLGNLSLAYNSIGFYQYVSLCAWVISRKYCDAELRLTGDFSRLAKIMTTPTVALLQFLFLSMPTTAPTLLALLTLCVGVGLTNSGAADTTAIGASIACAAFTVTAFYQVWIGKKMSDFKVNSPQLLLNQAPISVLLLAFLVPWFDTIPDFSKIPNDTLIALFLSGFAAAALVSFSLSILEGAE